MYEAKAFIDVNRSIAVSFNPRLVYEAKGKQTAQLTHIKPSFNPRLVYEAKDDVVGDCLKPTKGFNPRLVYEAKALGCNSKD